MRLPETIANTSNLNEGKPILLFDGVCNLCNSTVDFIIRRDRKKTLFFASLQSPFGQEIKKQLPKDIDSIVFIENGKLFIKSEAALKIAAYLGFPYNLLLVGKILPRKWRDASYDYVARNRYKWFNRKDSCRIPAPEERNRFIENF
ncbi:thiol-disulfide oxidoreductase DCC family protein [Sphingobacterium hungaricum]|uniref:Thiol-disulfide dehydrogenase n=1 Tax=Sphingobacterium hungaricum TaxID=2082723 RepID=A0A928YS00_9SPHI|nr:thiol-disulfide oxidoreductase DCC family protein [Sphingobacterium hungaricum]MBE8715499.1 thiol-disulfide dehydrogenase [Sphingobacterium hungaricum]